MLQNKQRSRKTGGFAAPLLFHWRGWVGIEPHLGGSAVHAGFEDRGAHQRPTTPI